MAMMAELHLELVTRTGMERMHSCNVSAFNEAGIVQVALAVINNLDDGSPEAERVLRGYIASPTIVTLNDDGTTSVREGMVLCPILLGDEAGDPWGGV